MLSHIRALYKAHQRLRCSGTNSVPLLPTFFLDIAILATVYQTDEFIAAVIAIFADHSD